MESAVKKVSGLNRLSVFIYYVVRNAVFKSKIASMKKSSTNVFWLKILILKVGFDVCM